MKTRNQSTCRVMVGVDDSDPSAAALSWAADEARRRELGPLVVTCWSYPAMPFTLYQLPISGVDTDDTS